MVLGLTGSCPVTKSQLSSIDFTINKFFMKLLQTSNMDIVNYCRQMFCSFVLIHRVLCGPGRRTKKFMSRLSQCDMIKYIMSI